MNYQSKVSVCLPTYNAGGFLPQAIDSILNQTFKDFEVIIVDDGSTDNTPEIINRYLHKDSRIKYFQNEQNLGIFHNWNKCLECASGDYINMFAQDDVMLPTNLETKVKIIDENPNLGLVTSSVKIIDAKGNLSQWDWANYPEDKLAKGREWVINNAGEANPICCPFVLINRRVLEKVGGKFNTNLAYASDFEMWLRIGLVADLYFIEETLGYYRWHEGNKTHSFDDFYKVEEQLRIWDFVIDSLGLSGEELEKVEKEAIARTIKWVTSTRIYPNLEANNLEEVFVLCQLLENWRGKPELSEIVEELGSKIQEILRHKSRLESEVEAFSNWVNNLEKVTSELQLQVKNVTEERDRLQKSNSELELEAKAQAFQLKQLKEEKAWLESQLKAWMLTAQKYR
ncbi:MAG: glycosyltransferase [Cyanobacteriota bacterium]|nr:glycosyltransferase [Cyanobacteriota bacterium]